MADQRGCTLLGTLGLLVVVRRCYLGSLFSFESAIALVVHIAVHRLLSIYKVCLENEPVVVSSVMRLSRLANRLAV